jgi:O-antigen ligase
MNGYTLISIIWEIVPDIGISLFVYKAMRLSKQNYINIAFKIITIYIIINFLTMILFPEGIASGRIGQTMWFLGGKNVILPYILLGISMVIIRSYSSKRHNTIGTYFYISILSILALFTDSSTIILIVILLMVGVIIEILIKRKLIEKIFSGRNLLVLVVAIFLFVVFFSTNKNIVKIITTWLGKDVTFNGRTALWTLCLSMIKLHPIIGSGPSLVLDVGWGVTMTHAHDLYLNIATKYGLPAFVMLLMILIHTFRNSKDSKMPLAWYALALYLVGSVVEVYSTNTLFLFCMTLSQCGIKKDNFAIKCSQLQ